VTIAPKDQDRKLPEKLRAELSGVLSWVVRGCCEWQSEGLKAPLEVRRATQEYRAEMDVIAAFLADCCVRGEDESAYAGQLWKVWQRWCEETGEQPGTQKRFGGRLSERGFLNHRDSKTGRKVWCGVSLHHNWAARAELSLNHGSTGFAGKTQNTEPSEPKMRITAPETEPRGVMCEKGSEGSESSVAAPQNERGAPSKERRELTEEEALQAQKLISQGMKPAIARAEVLGEEA